jgi:hypothetical protein
MVKHAHGVGRAGCIPWKRNRLQAETATCGVIARAPLPSPQIAGCTGYGLCSGHKH